MIYSKIAYAIGMIGLTAVGAYCNVNGEDAFWCYLGAFILFLTLGN